MHSLDPHWTRCSICGALESIRDRLVGTLNTYAADVDVLTDLLDRSHARGGAFGRTVLSEPWGVTFDLGLPLAVHAVLGGEARATSGGSSARLLAGDIAL